MTVKDTRLVVSIAAIAGVLGTATVAPATASASGSAAGAANVAALSNPMTTPFNKTYRVRGSKGAPVARASWMVLLRWVTARGGPLLVRVYRSSRGYVATCWKPWIGAFFADVAFSWNPYQALAVAIGTCWWRT